MKALTKLLKLFVLFSVIAFLLRITVTPVLFGALNISVSDQTMLVMKLLTPFFIFIVIVTLLYFAVRFFWRRFKRVHHHKQVT